MKKIHTVTMKPYANLLFYRARTIEIDDCSIKMVVSSNRKLIEWVEGKWMVNCFDVEIDASNRVFNVSKVYCLVRVVL